MNNSNNEKKIYMYEENILGYSSKLFWFKRAFYLYFSTENDIYRRNTKLSRFSSQKTTQPTPILQIFSLLMFGRICLQYSTLVTPLKHKRGSRNVPHLTVSCEQHNIFLFCPVFWIEDIQILEIVTRGTFLDFTQPFVI